MSVLPFYGSKSKQPRGLFCFHCTCSVHIIVCLNSCYNLYLWHGWSKQSTQRLSLSLLVVVLAIAGLLSTICKDTRVLCSVLAMLGSLQLGSRVCISVSTDHWYLRILPPFFPNLIVHMHIQTLKTQTVANMEILRILQLNIYYFFGVS